MAGAQVRIEGLRELEAAFRKADTNLRKELQRELRGAAQIVADDARAYMSGIGASRSTVSGLRGNLRGRSTAVAEQRRRTVTGKRGDWGARNMATLYHLSLIHI